MIVLEILLNIYRKCKVNDSNQFDLVVDRPVLDGGDDDDDEANVVDQISSDKCPLTQKPFVEPVQNKKCKHKYERQAILKYIADKNKVKRPAKCPLAGCNNVLHEKDLQTA